MAGITIDQKLLSAIRETYLNDMQNVRQVDREQKLKQVTRCISRLRTEEQRLGRLLITGKMSEESYEALRCEWAEPVATAEAELDALERENACYVNDLDRALNLLSQISVLYQRLNGEQHAAFLQVLVKRIIVREDGEIINHELHSPFAYLVSLRGDPPTGKRGLDPVRLGAFLLPVRHQFSLAFHTTGCQLK